MSTEQQIASVVIGWVFIGLSGAAVWFFHRTNKRYAERERSQQTATTLPR
jgi:cytoskeletal protein RodZ